MVEVEDEDGFDIPTLISECVVVESKGAAEKIAERQQQKTNTQKPKQVLIQEEEDDADETYAETKEGELINAALGFVPVNPNMISQTDCEIYLINDSNYYLVGYDNDKNEIRHFRVDKMMRAIVSEVPRSGEGEFKKYDINNIFPKII